MRDDGERDTLGRRHTVIEDEDLLLELLNSTPVVAGRSTEALTGEAARAFANRHAGTGSAHELAALHRMRSCLQDVVRTVDGAEDALAAALEGAALRPVVTVHGIDWDVDVPEDDRLAVRAALAWSRAQETAPGRLRPCANDECALFLLDRSRPGTAKWCSMAECGNRMKARAFANRRRKQRPTS